MYLIFILVAALIAFAIYLGVAGLIMQGLISVGLIRRPWVASVVTPLLMILWPAASMWQDRLLAEECIALNGSYDLSCTGELGGLFIDIFRILIILFSLIGGAMVGWKLARRQQMGHRPQKP